MKVLLKNKGTNTLLTRQTNYDSCNFKLTTPLDVLKVISSNEKDGAVILDMVSRHSLEVGLQLQLTKSVLGRPILNLTLESLLFPELKEKFGRDFTIKGEIELTNGRLETRFGGGMTIRIKNVEAKHGKSYTFQNVTYSSSLSFSTNGINNLRPLITKLNLNIEQKTAMTTKTSNVDVFEIYRKILNDGIGSDVTIIACNDAQIKCHKSLLIAHSTMFEGMLNSGMKEAITGVIKMPTFSEPVVRALLAYLYYWDLKEASSDCDIAVELFKAADYFNISRLQTDINKLLLNKGADWFSVDGALELFLLSVQLDRAELKSAALQALHMKFDELKTNASYLELLERDPTTALQCNPASRKKRFRRDQTANGNESEGGAGSAKEPRRNECASPTSNTDAGGQPL